MVEMTCKETISKEEMLDLSRKLIGINADDNVIDVAQLGLNENQVIFIFEIRIENAMELMRNGDYNKVEETLEDALKIVTYLDCTSEVKCPVGLKPRRNRNGVVIQIYVRRLRRRGRKLPAGSW